LETAQRERVPNPSERLDRSVRKALHHSPVVGEAGGEEPPGVEVVRAMGIEGDLPILVPHLLAQRVRFDE
jgi:hypothetical protein